MTEMSDTPLDQQRLHFTFVLAEVLFENDGALASRRIQFFSNSASPDFPAKRLFNLQNMAAFKVRDGLGKGAINFQAHEVLIHSLIPLGQFTTDEFFENDATAAAQAGTKLDSAEPEAPIHTAEIVPIRPE